MFIDEVCEDLKLVVDDGEPARKINRKKKPVVLKANRCPLCGKCYRRDCFFRNYVEYCESIK